MAIGEAGAPARGSPSAIRAAFRPINNVRRQAYTGAVLPQRVTAGGEKLYLLTPMS